MLSEGEPLRIAVVCEGPADQRTACRLADRVAQSGLEWLNDELLPSTRCWVGVQPDQVFLRWSAVKSEANKLTEKLGGGFGHRLHGDFAGEPGKPDAHIGRRALLVLKDANPPVAAALLIRDSDNDLRRRDGLYQARNAGSWPFTVIIGVAHPKRECWVLAAFEPSNDSERQLLHSLRKELGFDPTTQSEELTAKVDDAKRSAKRVWAELRNDDEERGLATTSLPTLKARGQNNGLAAYLAELEARYVPLFRSHTT